MISFNIVFGDNFSVKINHTQLQGVKLEKIFDSDIVSIIHDIRKKKEYSLIHLN